MVLISEKAKVRWNGKTKKHYVDLGYEYTKINEWFEVSIEHLMKTSPIKVQVKCDYCNSINDKSYRDIFKSNELVNKDCCSNRKCMVEKTKDINMIKYGVESYNSTKESKDRNRSLFQTDSDEVLKIATSKGIKILNIEDYNNDRTRLNVICNYHKDFGEQETNFANIKKNIHCCKYVRHDNDSKRLDGKIVLDAFIESNLIPLFEVEDYKNNMTPLPYTCEKHLEKGTQYRTYANLIHGKTKGCLHCSREFAGNILKLDYNVVESEYLNKGLLILEGQEYKSKEHKLKCKCINHEENIILISYGSIRNTKEPCNNCRLEKSTTNLSKILRNYITSWRKESEKECNYQCVLSGSRNYDVHHLYPFNKILKDVIEYCKVDINDYDYVDFINVKNKLIEKHDELLGVCLDRDLHVEFHKIYSKDNCSAEDFEDFKIKHLSKKKLLI